MQKHLLACLFILFFSVVGYAQPGGDCSNPIVLCASGQTEPAGFTGIGSIQTNGVPIGTAAEFTMQGNTCSAITLPSAFHFLPTGGGERWYSFEVTQSGELCMAIVPNNNADNYEYILFDVTGGVTCADIQSNTLNYIVDCDYTTPTVGDATTGFSGITNPGTGAAIPGNDPCIQVTAGEEYLLYLVIDNSYNGALPATSSGFTFDQNNLGEVGAASIADIIPPVLTTSSINPITCGNTSINITFSEELPCSDGFSGSALFNITNPDGGIISSADYTVTGTSCTPTDTTSSTFTIDFNQSVVTMAGTYTIQLDGVSDQCNNINTTDVITFEVLPAFTNTMASTDNINCTAPYDGTATVNITSGPNPNYTFTWSGGTPVSTPTSSTTSTLEQGRYYVTIEDAIGCSKIDSVDVGFNPANAPFISPAFTMNKDTCGAPGNASGWGDLDISVTGGTGTISYLWSNGATTEDLTDVPMGIYTLTVSDDAGCVTELNGGTGISITNYAVSYTVNISAVDDTCGRTVGSVTVNSITDQSGGSYGAFDYNWNNTGSSANNGLSPLNASSNSVFITDRYGCTVTASANVGNFKPTIAFTIDEIPDTCSTLSTPLHPGPVGQLVVTSVNATNGSISAPFNWSIDNEPFGPDSIFTDLGIGSNYIINFIDNNGCDTSISGLEITNFEPVLSPSWTVNQDTCEGSIGSLEIIPATGAGNYNNPTFLWDDNATTTADYNSLLGGAGISYTITVTDAYGCATIASSPLPNFTPTYSFSNTIIDDTCRNSIAYFGGISTVVSTNSFTPTLTYSWTGGNITPPSVNAATLTALEGDETYQLEIEDQFGCTATESMYVPNHVITYNITTQEISPALCSSPTGSGEITSIVDNSGNNIGLTDPSITYTWTSAEGGNNVGFPYLIDSVVAAAYTVEITDQYSCIGSNSVNISSMADPDLMLTLESVSPPTCHDSSDAFVSVIPVDASAPSPYADSMFIWNDLNVQQNDTAFNLSPGDYSVTITDTNGCIASLMINIPDTDPVSLSTTNDTIICIDGNVTLQGFAGGGTTGGCTGGVNCYDYEWYEYPVTAPGFDFTQSVNVTPTYTPNTPITYQVVAFDINGCRSDSELVVISFYDSLEIAFAEASYTICAGDNQDLAVSVFGGNGDNEFLWSTGETDSIITVNPQSDDVYAVTVSNGGNCNTPEVDSSVTIDVSPLAVVDFTANTLGICPGDSVNFTINQYGDTNIYQFGWGDNSANYASGNTISHIYEESGMFNVTLEITTPVGCVSSGTLFPDSIEVYPQPENDYTYVPNPPTTVNPDVIFTNLTADPTSSPTWWIGNEGFTQDQFEYSFLTPDSVYLCTLTTINANFCTDTTIFEIIVEATALIYVPSAFTPNADEHNGTWGPIGEGINDNCNYSLTVFNRYGREVFYTRDFYEQWDGKDIKTGKLVAQGMYVYEIKYLDEKGKKQELNGYVFVINPIDN